MLWLIALGLLLALPASADHHTPFSTSNQAHPVNTTYNLYALHPMFRYYPPQAWPLDPSDGWNFSTTIGAPSPYNVAERRLIHPYTTYIGAEVSNGFFGNGATIYGWAAAGTRITLAINDDRAVEFTFAERKEGELASVMVEINDWRTFKVTLNEGGLQLSSISYHQTLDLDYASQEDAPIRVLKTIDDDGTTIKINPFFKTEGKVTPAMGDVGEEGRPIAKAPESVVSFRTWPNATVVTLTGQVSVYGGVIAYDLVPEPAEVNTVKWDLLRPHNYYTDVGYHLIDPKQRFTMRVKNDHPSEDIFFYGTSFLLASDDGLSWDPLTDTMKEGGSSKKGGGNSTSTPNSGDGSNNNTDSEDKSETKQESIKHSNAGAIAGGVVGGLVGAVLLSLLLLACLSPARFRRLLPCHPKPQATGFTVDDELDVTEAAPNPVVTAFPVPMPAPDTGSRHANSGLNVSPSKETQQLLPGNEDAGENEHPQVEDDAGPVPARLARGETLPPTYNPAWAGTGSGTSDAGPSDTADSGASDSQPGTQPLVSQLSDTEEPRQEAAPLPLKS